jgi:FtsH-binding integral membrane protein
MSSSDGFDGLRGMSQAINEGINETVVRPVAKHLAAPPVEKNRNRAIWGTRLVVACLCLAYGAWIETGYSVTSLARSYWRMLHAAPEDSWPVYGWTAAMLLGLLWLSVGVKGSRGPRDVMMAFWAMLRVAIFAGALWWYPAIDPKSDWLIQGVVVTLLASSLMSLYLALRGTGTGAVRLIQQQILRQAKRFRLGRQRKF